MSKYECYGDNHKGYIIDTTKIPNYKSREDFEKEALQKIDCSDEEQKDDALNMAYLKWQDYLLDYTLDLQEVRDTLNQYESENKEICKYIQRKINECDSPTKLDEIGVLTDPGAAWGYCKALNQIKKGLQYRKLWVDDAE